jgi:predicted dehydrogenase
MAESIRWGILGNAKIARVCVIPAIQQSNNGTVHALASQSPETARETAEKNHIPRLYDSYDALLADRNIEAVYIPLPNHLHLPWALKSLQAGKPVLCEKPLACNALEAAKMIRAAAESKLLLMEALMYRFHPRSRHIKQLVSDGRIGTPRLVRAAFTYGMERDIREQETNFRLRPETGGGALLDVGCYCVSVARWLIGSEPARVQAQAAFNQAGVDMHLVGNMIFPGGALGSAEVSFTSALQQTYSVIGDEGGIELPHDAFIPWSNDARYRLRGATDDIGREFVVAGVDEYRLMVEHFADVLKGHTAPEFPATDSLDNMRVLDAMAEAARCGRSVAVNPAEQGTA